ncbi:beta-glucosidase [Bacteroidia bacterium]|nr:beta-glucosidase [Bacteroidia bacterium]
MKRIPFVWLVLSIAGACSHEQQPAYKNPHLSIEQRTQDLLARMTLEEKVGQLLCPLGWEMYEKRDGEISVSAKFETLVQSQHIGMLWATYRADPWTKKTIANGLNPQLAAEAGNALQKYAVENTRLGIPLFLAEECPHGHMAIGTTVFPTGIGQAATWNPALIEAMAAVIAQELRLQGGHIGYGPVMDLSRDPRWSRVEESYGEDPVLTARMGAAFVKGTGAGNISGNYSIISTLKHFVAYGIPQGGHNGNVSLVGQRELAENFLPPFKAAIDAGALSVMTAYNSIDGVPCTSNDYLLTDLLRNKWHFKGFTVSDLGSIEGLASNHYIAPTTADAAVLAANAGLDVDLGGNAFPHLVDAVKGNKIKASVIDTAVCRVLRLKLAMGLFENPYINPAAAKEQVQNAPNISLARQVARESIVLLKNKNNLLPLNKQGAKNIVVIGPNADNKYNMLGDYTAPQQDSVVQTVLDGMRAKLTTAQVKYVKGCAIRDTAHTEIAKAVRAAQTADVIVAVVGGSSARDFKTQYIETGAAVAQQESLSDMENGEGFDRANLDLMGKQMDLLQALKSTGKPLVVVYIQGRPLNMNWAAENADALLTAWYPGQEGGNAVADVLLGDYNPAGRLPISIPRNVGQIPVYYNKKNPRGHHYVEMSATPLYNFGYGLSYTVFEYSNLKIVPSGKGYEVSLSVKNTGMYDGGEVVQLYIRDEYASVVQPIKQLKHFARIHLQKGEEKDLAFLLTKEDLSIVNQRMERVVEAGQFVVMLGASSDDIRLQSKLTVEL